MYSPGRQCLSLLTMSATLLLVFAGGLVTSTGSGLAVPDWPLSYGMWMPPMVGGIFFEHGHRMVAATVGLLTLILAVWTGLRETRAGVRRLAWSALGVVITQGLLGGLTVLFLLPTAISVSHACLAQVFFCLTIALAYSGSREWLAAEPRVTDTSGVRLHARLATGVVFIQLLLGALMRHLGAGLAIPDFPLALGRLVPPIDSLGVAVHFAHRLGAVVVLVAVGRLLAVSLRSRVTRLRDAAVLAALLTALQLVLGAWTVLSARAVVPTTFHVATGALVLGGCFFASLRAERLLCAARAHDSALLAGLPA